MGAEVCMCCNYKGGTHVVIASTVCVYCACVCACMLSDGSAAKEASFPLCTSNKSKVYN